jgi:hypothetical protein
MYEKLTNKYQIYGLKSKVIKFAWKFKPKDLKYIHEKYIQPAPRTNVCASYCTYFKFMSLLSSL